jgi:hypothetical protein
MIAVSEGITRCALFEESRGAHSRLDPLDGCRESKVNFASRNAEIRRGDTPLPKMLGGWQLVQPAKEGAVR